MAGHIQPLHPPEPGISEKQLPAPLWTIVRAESFLSNSSALIGLAFLCSLPIPAPLSWEVKFFTTPCYCIFICNMVSKRLLGAVTMKAESQRGQQCKESYKSKSREHLSL